MTLDDPPPTTPKLRLIGTVWAVVGVVAIVVGLLVTTTVVVIFGGLALLAGVAVYSAQAARERSAENTARRLSGGPVPPAGAPGVPTGAPGPRGGDGAGVRRRPWLRGERDLTVDDGKSGGETGDPGDTTGEPSEDSSPESDDGTGSTADGGDAEQGR